MTLTTRMPCQRELRPTLQLLWRRAHWWRPSSRSSTSELSPALPKNWSSRANRPRSIIKRTHHPAPLKEHILTAARDAVQKPVRFVCSAPYILITSLYLATYLSANLTDTLSSTVYNAKPDKVYAGTSKFAATSATNLAMCLYKDAQFAKMFGANGSGASKPIAKPTTSFTSSTPASIRNYATAAAAAVRDNAPSAARTAAVSAPKVPRISLALFAVRDSMTIFASFNVPPILGPVLGSQSAAQFIAPAMVQFVSTPLHLLGLDIYNRPTGCSHAACSGGITRACRWQCVRRDWLGAAFARIGRIVPAFGVGGVVNAGVRKSLMGKIDP